MSFYCQQKVRERTLSGISGKNQKNNNKTKRKKNQKKQTGRSRFSSFFVVKLRFQKGSFRSHHAWQKGCFCLSEEKAKASLADMHDTQAMRKNLVLTITGVWFVSLLKRSSCSLLFLLTILVTATLQESMNTLKSAFMDNMLWLLSFVDLFSFFPLQKILS